MNWFITYNYIYIKITYTHIYIYIITLVIGAILSHVKLLRAITVDHYINI